MKNIIGVLATFLLISTACTRPAGQESQLTQRSAGPDSLLRVAAPSQPVETPPAPLAEALEVAPVSTEKPESQPVPPAPKARASEIASPSAPAAPTPAAAPIQEPPVVAVQPPAPATTPREVVEAPAPEPQPAAFSHEAWDQLLQKHVSAAGKVNYRGFKQDMAPFQAYLDQLSSHPPQSDWSRDQRLAYWINVYNAFTVKLIVDHYPTTSITTLEGGKPWNKRWIRIGDKTYTLDEVENAVIRKQFTEPRIHFAVNCASISCPELLNRAYTAEKLSQQLETQTRKYINNPKHNSLGEAKPQVSQLFEWYADDFKQKDGSVIAFINRFAATKINENATLAYKAYDWNLNE